MTSNKIATFCFTTFLFVAIATSPANALLVTGEAMIIPAPPSAAHMQLESSEHAFVWVEQMEVVRGGTTAVSVIPFKNNPSGFYDSGNPAIENQWAGDLGPGVYDSYFFHADKQGAAETFTGTITVPADIVGIVYRQPWLNDTDPIFGAPGTIYADGPNRFYELDGAQNWFEISMDLRTLSFQTVVLHNMDDLRIITKHVPEPSACGLVLLGCLGLLRRRQSC
ncbi:MAG: PEP-CTERM sorting domain-containing protein [Planctomycetota bacterium]